ncbi:MAG: tRNA lysidine(34) synthetase TilS [Kiloniellaceae bacterium]
MARLGPFEPAPQIAVGVSGGADSLALAVLLDDWARARAGRVVALTVDHGLRRESAAEAAQVGRVLAALGLAHRTLRWRGTKPPANVQAAARRARYDLLTGWCARHRVLHLALAHQRDDQAETLLLRLGRGSGVDGLAAMAPVAELSAVRVLRPLLPVPKARLEATLAARGLPWIEDPTNRDPAHARARLRRLMPALASEGLTADRLGATAAHLGRARAALEAMLARLLARAATVHPAGFIELDPVPLAAAPAEVGLRALSRVLMTVGGLEYAPRLERLERLHARLVAGLDRGATLGGCRVLPRRGRLLVVRESAAAAACPLRPGEAVLWDGRFEIAVRGGPRQPGDLRVDGLGAAGWTEARRAAPEVRATLIPAPARPALPALRDTRGLLAVPHLGYRRAGGQALTVTKCRFAPRNGLTTGTFTVA